MNQLISNTEEINYFNIVTGNSKQKTQTSKKKPKKTQNESSASLIVSTFKQESM